MNILLPHSKSIDLRILALRYVASVSDRQFPEDDEGWDDCADTREFHDAIEILKRADSSDEIPEVSISEGAAPFRFFLALAASSPGKRIRIRIGERLSLRPHLPLVKALRESGASIDLISEREYIVEGKRLRGGRIAVDSSLSSQYPSALLLASPLWDEPLILGRDTENIPSRPYLDMTIEMLRKFREEGLLPERERDWSAAAFWIEARLLAEVSGLPFPEISFPGLLPPGASLQGDSRAEELGRMFLYCTRMEVDMERTPDLVPAFAFLSGLGGKSFRFTGVANLRLKESDRLESLREELGKFGCRIKLGENYIEGDPAGKAGDEEIRIDPHEDHRIAMAAAMARFASWRVSIEHQEVVRKSYPMFWEALGLMIEDGLS